MSERKQIITNKIFATKQGMGTIYTEQGDAVPVTLLKFEEWLVSQVKTVAVDGYSALQVVSGYKKRASRAILGHLAKLGLKNGVAYTKEIRLSDQGLDASVGDQISLSSISVGDLVSVAAVSKGKGFAGSVRRFGFAGGPASHGSKFHRRPGSSGNRTWPGRVMPGKKFPGHLGAKRVTTKNLKVVAIDPVEKVLMLKGAVPGAKNTLVEIAKG